MRAWPGTPKQPERGRDSLPIPPLSKRTDEIADASGVISFASDVRKRAVRRAALAGIAWGAPMAMLFTALDVWRCGVLCLTDAAFTVAITTFSGISTIGVFAACFGGTAPALISRRKLMQKGTSWHVRYSWPLR
jgi:hypothetical protein